MIDSIVTGLFGTLGKLLADVPLTVWLILFLAVLAAIFVIRYVTDWKVVIPLVVIAFLGSEVLAWRHHWIAMGKAEVEAQLAAYKKTNGLVIACYAKNQSSIYLWDRTQGKCLRADGAIE